MSSAIGFYFSLFSTFGVSFAAATVAVIEAVSHCFFFFCFTSSASPKVSNLFLIEIFVWQV